MDHSCLLERSKRGDDGKIRSGYEEDEEPEEEEPEEEKSEEPVKWWRY